MRAAAITFKRLFGDDIPLSLQNDSTKFSQLACRWPCSLKLEDWG